MWQIAVFSRIILAYVFFPIVLKKITTLPSRTKRLYWQFAFCALISVVVALVSRNLVIDWRILFLLTIGIFNSFAAYCQWRAYDITVSKTALFTQADDIIAMGLGYFFLKESWYLNLVNAFGIFLCMGLAIVFFVSKNRRQSNSQSQLNLELLRWVAGYSVIWGVAIFSMRGLALSNLPLPSFLVGWYSGSFLGSLIIRQRGDISENGNSFNRRDILGTLLLAILILSSLLLHYIAFRFAPIIIVQPIFQASEIIFPALIGLWVFKEIKTLALWQKMVFAGCAIGVTLLAIS